MWFKSSIVRKQATGRFQIYREDCHDFALPLETAGRHSKMDEIGKTVLFHSIRQKQGSRLVSYTKNTNTNGGNELNGTLRSNIEFAGREKCFSCGLLISFP